MVFLDTVVLVQTLHIETVDQTESRSFHIALPLKMIKNCNRSEIILISFNRVLLTARFYVCPVKKKYQKSRKLELC